MQDYSGDVQSFRVCKKNTWTAKVTQEKFLSPHLQEYKQMKCQNYYDYASVLSWVVDFMAAFAICNAVLLPRSANCDWIDNRKLWSWQLQLAAGQYGTGNFICSPLFFFLKMVNVPEGRNTFPSTACNISGCVQLEVGQFLQMCDMQVIVYYIKQMTNGVVALIRQSSGQFAVHK